MIKHIVKREWFKAMMSFIPVVGLALTTLSTVYYYFFNDEYLQIYSFISMFWGFSVFSLPAYFYIAYSYNLCSYTKFALWGITAYVVINFGYQFFNLFGLDISSNIYAKVMESLVISTLLTITLILLIKTNAQFRNSRGED